MDNYPHYIKFETLKKKCVYKDNYAEHLNHMLNLDQRNSQTRIN